MRQFVLQICLSSVQWFRLHFYWPQRSWAKVMFLQASVILSTKGWSGAGGWSGPGEGWSGPRWGPPIFWEVYNFLGGLQFFGGL